jgi:L-lactate dehydrogenase complex protein LldE
MSQNEQIPQRVLLFVTCTVDQLYPQVGESVVNVLERQGCEVDFPPGQTCCGQPAFNAGFTEDAKAVARRFLDVFAGEDPIVVPSGSCGAMVRNFYPELFHDDPETLAKVRQVAGRLYEFSEFVVDVLHRDDLAAKMNGSATYHQCCHLLRELGIDAQPKTLLGSVEGLEVLPMEQSEVCCGFGGTFAVKFPELSTAMLNDKLDYALATGADTLVAGDTTCLMHLEGGVRKRGDALQIRHLAQVLDEATSSDPINHRTSS